MAYKRKATDAVRIGKNIREYREAKGYSQEEFAFECGYHRTFIGTIERGDRNITVRTLLKVAKTLKVKPEKLLVGLVDW